MHWASGIPSIMLLWRFVDVHICSRTEPWSRRHLISHHCLTFLTCLLPQTHSVRFKMGSFRNHSTFSGTFFFFTYVKAYIASEFHNISLQRCKKEICLWQPSWVLRGKGGEVLCEHLQSNRSPVLRWTGWLQCVFSHISSSWQLIQLSSTNPGQAITSVFMSPNKIRRILSFLIFSWYLYMLLLWTVMTIYILFQCFYFWEENCPTSKKQRNIISSQWHMCKMAHW